MNIVTKNTKYNTNATNIYINLFSLNFGSTSLYVTYSGSISVGLTYSTFTEYDTTYFLLYR